MGKVVVGLSGGVDSAVAAGLLLRAGYDVCGVFIRLAAVCAWDGEQHLSDARGVADLLGIELSVVDMSEAFEPIIENFVAEYVRGRTPNPCIHCNAMIKFGKLIEWASSRGCEYVATGHHARIVEIANRERCICRGMDLRKDQSYALFGIAREKLAHILLPVGEIDDKEQVRDLARSLGLSVHDKSDSQEICFVPDDDYVSFLRGRCDEALRPGKIINAGGEVVGEHDGYARYTIGQRRGLGVGGQAEPIYVTGIDPASATVTVGPREQVLSRSLTASSANWHCEVSGEFEADVQIRYNHRGAKGRVRITGQDTFEVDFDEPVNAITPGQAAVVYDSDRLLGGGWIC